MPATYVVDGTRRIRYAFVDTDHTRRAEPAEVFAVLRELGHAAPTGRLRRQPE